MNYRRKENVVVRQVAGEHVLIPVNAFSSKVFTLNPVGLRLWEKLAEPSTEDELARALVDCYGIELERALADTRSFLGEMTRLDLVVSE